MRRRDKPRGAVGAKGRRVEEQRREGRRDVREPKKERGRLGGRAPDGLEPAGSSPWQPQWI